VTRALVVAELAVGSVLADQLRLADSELVEIHTARQVQVEARASSHRDGSGENATFVEQLTIPFVSTQRALSHDDTASPEIVGAIRGAIRHARGKAVGGSQRELVDQALASLETIAIDNEGTAVAVMGARDLYGVRTVDEAGIGPLFDALDRARVLATAGVHALGAGPDALTSALRRISVAHQRLVGACAHIVIEAAAPAKDKLREAQATTSDLRRQVARWERKLGDLERKFATVVDPSTPWQRIQETVP
jgi:hypothetical protein